MGSGALEVSAGSGLADNWLWGPGRVLGSLFRGPSLVGWLKAFSPLPRFRVARIPEQRSSVLASEVKTIAEAGPSPSEPPDSPQPGLPAEQRALLGSGGSHTKWLKVPAESKAEVRCRRPQWGGPGALAALLGACLTPTPTPTRRTATWSG